MVLCWGYVYYVNLCQNFGYFDNFFSIFKGVAIQYINFSNFSYLIVPLKGAIRDF